jgi:hypothetical protein
MFSIHELHRHEKNPQQRIEAIIDKSGSDNKGVPFLAKGFFNITLMIDEEIGISLWCLCSIIMPINNIGFRECVKDDHILNKYAKCHGLDVARKEFPQQRHV